MTPMAANRIVPLTLLALLVAGCAAAAPGYEPLSKTNQKRLDDEAKAPPPSGGMTGQGTYVLTDEEKRYDCRKLSTLVQLGILRLRDGHRRPEPSAISEAGKQVGAIMSPRLKYKGTPEAAEERAKVEAYNKALAEKRCRTFDVAAGIKADGKAPVPVPIAPEPKKK